MSRRSDSRRRTATRAAVLTAAVAALAGCVQAPAVTVASATASPASSSSASPAPSPPAGCNDETRRQSYAPAATSAYATEIKNRGYLLVGVSADTRLLGAVDPNRPSVFEGFDIDMARLVAKAIFGDENKIRFKAISTGTRISQLRTEVDDKDNAAGGVDMVARAFTMTCSRWAEIAFSAEYFRAHQGVLVPAAVDTANWTKLADLDGKTVCASKGSTTIAKLETDPAITAVALVSNTDCMVLLQQSKVDAVSADNTILAGFAAQDPGTEVAQKLILSDEPYGIGVPLAHKDFAAYLNTVVANAVKSGAWQASYDKWLAPALGPGTPPAPFYGRT